MASILISRSMIRIFSGFKHFLAPRREATRIPNLQAPLLNFSISRCAQRAVDFAPQIGQKLDKVLYKIDSEIRRTGRISRKEIDDVLGEPNYLKYASSTQSLLLLRCLGSLLTEELPEVRNGLVQDIWDTLLKYNIPLDISHYNTLLRVYLENGHEFSPIEFLSSLENAGIEPNRVTYQRMIARYCHEGDIDGASKILEFMKERELPVNENVFNSLVMGHARANDLESAHGVLSVMKTSGLMPSAETYMMLLVGYAEKGDVEGLNKVLAESELSEVQLQNREFMEVIYALASKGHSRHVSVFIEKLEKVAGYQQDVMTLVYRLVNAGCDEIAYQMFETLALPQNSDGDTVPVGTFFLKQLIKSGLYSVVTVVQYCQKMKREGLNIYALERSLNFALVLGRPELSLALMRVMAEDGASVRPHYFWPVIMHYANQGDKENVYRTVREMVEMEIPISLETCRDYVMPTLLEKEKDEEPIILALKDCGMQVPTVVNGIVANYLQTGDTVAAAQLLSRYKVRITPMIRKDLFDAYSKTKEASASVAVLRQMLSDSQRKEDAISETSGDGQTVSGRNTIDTAGMFLMDIVMGSRGKGVISILEPILEAMKTQGISISKDSSKDVQMRIGEDLTENVINLLTELSSGDLTLQPLSRDMKPLPQLSVEELEHRYAEFEIKNMPHTNILSQLLSSHARMRNVEKAEQVWQKLQAQEFPLTAGQYVLLMDMYIYDNQLEKALDTYKELKAKEPDCFMNVYKVLRLCNAVLSQGMFEESIKLLEENAKENDGEREDPTVGFACGSLLNAAIDKTNVSAAQMQQLFDTLVKLNYTKPCTSICSPIVRMHVKNDNMNEAMEAFEKFCKEYSLTPFKHELTLACIKLEDTEKLQRIMDMSIGVHGEMNSLYDLVFAFIECGKVRQAKKILETPGLRARSNRLEQRCKKLLDDNRITEMEHLVAITKDVFDIDRQMMFSYLLEAYKSLDDCDKALGIWTTMQEENIEPSDAFLWGLGNFLMAHGQKVPFVMPQPQTPSKPKRREPEPQPTPKKLVSPPPKTTQTVSPKAPFIQAIKEENYEEAVEVMKSLKKSGVTFSSTDQSKVVEGFVKESKLESATNLMKEMVVAGELPIQRVLKYFMGRLSAAGDVESIRFFDEYLNDSSKRNVAFNSKVCNTYMNAGRSEEFLDSLSTLVDTPNVDAAQLKNRIPVGGLLGILEKEPQLLSKVNSIAERFAKHNISSVGNCLWAHQFSKGDLTEAKETYGKYLASSEDPLMFASITNKARDTSSAELLPPLIEILNSRLNTPSSAKGIVYSCWLDVLSASQKYDEALGVLEGSLKSITLQDINATALNRVKNGLAASNKTFPYEIPPKGKKDQQQSSSSSSSSSSDSDRDRKA